MPNQLTGYAPNILATTAYGTQANPLDSFYSASGSTGNKTTNKDLPQWLRALGMKGDAYAGGMLKPQIRYGFWYKDGKINFADGTSFAAKKNKGGTYSYTDASGKAQTYSPTDEQNAYNKKYKLSTSNQSFLDKATNAVKFELDHGKQIISNIKPSQVFFGIDPIGTKIGNAVTGSHATAQVDQLGGALGSRYKDYENRTGNSTGYANSLQGVAHVVAGVMGGQGAANGLGNLAGSVGQGTNSAFADLSQGYQGAGLGNAGNLANSGAIAGGAGVGGTTAGSLGGASGAANSVSGVGGSMAGNSNLWGNLLQLGGSLYNTYQQQQGAKDAANASIKGDANAIAEQRRQFDLARGDQMPWLQAGTAALGRLQDPQANFTASPGYAFTRAEGTRDIGNSFAARGGALSGNALRGLDAYNTGLASNEYNNWWNQQAGLAGVGQTSAQSLGGLGQNSANNVSNLLSSQGNARASGIVDQTNATTNGINDIANWYGNWMRNRQYGGG